MLLILHSNIDENSEAYRSTFDYLQRLPGIKIKKHLVQGQQQALTEIYLIGDTHALDKTALETLPAVERAIKISEETQNFELLKAIGKQNRFPALLKRGFGITLSESLNAAEYLASEGNDRVIFCLRGMKSEFGAPHRNMVDFAQIPVIKRLTRMPVCIDPSHSVGTRDKSPDGMLDLLHATAQGVIAGANMILVDFHPNPKDALVDGPQALLLSELDKFLQDVEIARGAYFARKKLWSK